MRFSRPSADGRGGGEEAKKQKGYRGACLLVDRAAGQGRTVTFWRSEKDALAIEKTEDAQTKTAHVKNVAVPRELLDMTPKGRP
jgi:heme-degrading monooxygenase HmoA